MKYNKLVRDNIPKIIEKNGEKAVVHTANEEEYREKLREKLIEEVQEFLEDESIGELADILQVVYAFCELKGIDKQELESLRKEKEEKRGGFKERIILEETHNG